MARGYQGATDEGFSGMRALIQALRQYGAEVQQEASGIALATAQLMKAELDREYPVGPTGKLVNGTRIIVEEPHVVRVKNVARHAHLWERGTVERFEPHKGASRGRMFERSDPASVEGKHTFVRAAVKARERMLREFRALLLRARVRGMTGTPEVRE